MQMNRITSLPPSPAIPANTTLTPPTVSPHPHSPSTRNPHPAMRGPSFIPSRPIPRPHAPPRRPRVTCRTTPPTGPQFTRRALLAGLASLPLQAGAATLLWKSRDKSTSSTVFSVIPTTVSSVNLQPIDIEDTITDMSSSDAVFLGEHHNSLVDHALQARIIESLHFASGRQPFAVGLEMVQQKFQHVLDAYLAGDASELDVYLQTEWETRWVWPYELYLPVLRVCKKHGIPMVALSMDFETLTKLRVDGVTALTQEDFRTHIGDPRVFAAIVKEPGFKAYINECVTPSYATHVRMGLLSQTANFNSFYTSRVFRDEAMATRAVRTVQEQGGMIVCLLGGDHVKFEYGVPGRVARQLQAVREKQRGALRGETSKERVVTEPARIQEPKIRTAMLNPSPADAYDARDSSLKLEMAVEGTPIPIADYLWFSSLADAKPRKQAKKKWLLPPVERLTSL